ncbi:hypothetical protein I8J29_26735 [Paenibacillus sp. MWE-103]|uniref:DUF4440 domain-containing protein n=1 Tax=Paenibacillus artemisiicola TaxID=1172618 RepID=A0ABS3WHM4_9BACL|nr:hypothetical protein [Paenibacillus artemisiicola]MBO7747792.1 hypothetical protein [Paenibacillus artemisiicola]
MRRRGKGRAWLTIAIGVTIVWVLWLTWHNGAKLFSSGDKGGAIELVEQFYQDEQAGDYGSAWELFHPLMQKHYGKSEYIQKRAHVTMQDFGAQTFEYTLGPPKLLSGWKMSSDSAEFQNVYEIVVTQKFHSAYGNFELIQSCYVANESGAWKLLWSFQNDV